MNSRTDEIRRYIDINGEAKVKELENMFPEISAMTIRRDLSYLEGMGYIVRTRGGAKSIRHLSKSSEVIYSLRAVTNVDAKEKIAQKAVGFVEEGHSIFIDSGTTMMYFARSIPDTGLSILTSGPNIGLELIKKGSPSVMIIGGQLNRNTLSISGPSSQLFLNDVNIDIAFMAASGFSLEYGFTSGDFFECALKKEIIKKARKVILLMDTSKLNMNMTYTFASLKDIDVFICESALPDDIMMAAQKNGVEIC
jgi:DeoR/GlpR family transcriptional regulator of sugar metabolism